jgi:long-chain acyl-CoA synthetase
MDGTWLNHYPKGVPACIDVHQFSSLCDVLQQSVQRFGDLPAYSNLGSSLSYRRLDQASRDFAAYLQKVVNLKKGDRVALMMPNVLQYPVAMFGVLRAGLVVVNVNPLYTAPELAHQLKDSGAVAIVVLENFAHTLQDVLRQNPQLSVKVISTEVGDLFAVVKKVVSNIVVKYARKLVPNWTIAGSTKFNAALRAGRALVFDEVALTHEDTAFLQYTGGTTGTIKGAVLTHGNMVANVQQLSAWIGLNLQDGKEVFICPLPVYHIYALSSMLVFMKIGAHAILITNPRDMHAFIHELKRYRFTAIIGVNTLYRALLDAPEFAEVDTGALKLSNAGGMAVQRVVAQAWQKATGVPIIESYGLTEASPGVTSNPLGIKDWTGDIGMPLPSTQVRVVDDHDVEVANGQVGEICVRGPQVMARYWNLPQETAHVFTSDGWLHTGDMGLMNEAGSLRITDRKKDIIIVSGFKVFPNQIEDVVASHPGVLEVGAIGVPNERTGESVKIVVVKRDLSLTEQDLLDYCRQQLVGYKMPSIVEFRVMPLPKSNIGKILRRQLR